MAITKKMKSFLLAASVAKGPVGYAVPTISKRQASMARAYGFGDVLDIGRHRWFTINQAGRDAVAQQ